MTTYRGQVDGTAQFRWAPIGTDQLGTDLLGTDRRGVVSDFLP